MNEQFTNIPIYKKALSVFISALLIVSLSPVRAFAEVRQTDIVDGESVADRGLATSQSPNIDCEYAVVMDIYGNVVFERNANESTKIASVTKIMTALVTVEYGDLNDEITVSKAAADIGESTAQLKKGDVLSVETALKALMIPSGNDAAYALAEYVGQKCIDAGQKKYSDAENKVEITDPVEYFVCLMNEKAAELKCTNTKFNNPHGLDDGKYRGDAHSCAIDVAKFTREAMKNDTIREIVCLGDTNIIVKRNGISKTLKLTATDLFLNYYKYAIGVKTGHTDSAGYCFSGAARNDEGVELYAIVLKNDSDSGRFEDTQALFMWSYAHRVEYKLANSNEYSTQVIDGETVDLPIVARVSHAGWTDKTFAATLEDPDQNVIVFDFDGNISQEFEFDEIKKSVKVGDKVGTVTFKQRNEIIATCTVVAAEDFKGPNFFQAIGIFFKRLFSFITGAQKVADTEIINQLPLLNDNKTAGTDQ